jgi:hypothetical protein
VDKTTEISFSQEHNELPFVTACVARCSNEFGIGVPLLESLLEAMSAHEMTEYHRFYETLTFKGPKARSLYDNLPE